jgi:multisubunit Na+/H+ antiporter MnhB subunit
MILLQALDIGLATLVFAVAAWTIFARGAFAATVGYVVYGLLLALVWIRLFAVDVALTEAAIGGGLGGVLLLSAAARLRKAAALAVERSSRTSRLCAGILSASITAALGAAILDLPDAAPTLAPLVVANAGATGLGNAVTNVLMAFRGMDTMLEKVVLLLALVGVWSLASDEAWGGRPGLRHEADPDGVLAFLARLLPPAGIVVGVYILWTGADHPGGAFQGGAVLASMWLLVIMAGLADTPRVSSRSLRLILVAGPGLFLVVGLVGLCIGPAFLAYPAAVAKPLILAIEIAMILTIAATLALLLAGAPERSASQ